MSLNSTLPPEQRDIHTPKPDVTPPLISGKGMVPYHWTVSHVYRPQRSCGKVMFLHLSVILFTGGCLPLPLPWSDTPMGRHPLLGRHPPGRHTPAKCMLGFTPLCAVHAGIRSTSGRYASYWNAFLLVILLMVMLIYLHPLVWEIYTCKQTSETSGCK